MALIQCTDCEKMISEHATVCPNCGCPMSIILENTKKKKISATEVQVSEGTPAMVNVNTENAENADSMAYVVLRSLCAIPNDLLETMVPKTEVNEEEKTCTKNCEEAEVGAYIRFGKYKQDGDIPQDIEWIVLAKEKNRMLVISRYGLECQRYHNVRKDVVWAHCTLRTWLNAEFLNTVFTVSEQATIQTTNIKETVRVTREKKTWLARIVQEGIEVNIDVQDKIFLLSIDEVETYFALNMDRKCQSTAYIQQQGVLSNNKGICWWLLRTPGEGPNRIACVTSTGSFDFYGDHVDYDKNAVRPAMWISLES